MVIIWGTCEGSILPGILVPSAEQKQSGKTHCVVSQSGARFGSKSTAKLRVIGQHGFEKATQHRINHVRIGFLILTTRILIRFIFTFRFAVTKQLFLDTFAITAR